MPAFVIDDPQALLNLWKLGLNDHFLFFKQYSESQVAFEVPYGQSTAFSTIFEFRSVLLNPFIVTSSRHRNKNTLGRFSNREDSDPFISLTKLLGCTADIVRDAARAASMFPSSNNLVVGNVTLSQPNTYEPGYKSTGASLVTSWIIAVIALPVLLGSFSIVYGFYRKSVGKPLIVFDQSVYVFGRTINIQKAIEQATLLAGLFSATGWLIFVIGGGSLIAASNRTLDPAGLTFLLAVIGLTTCFFSVVSTVFRYKPFMLVHTTLVIFTLISAGHVIQAGLISDMTYQGIRLMIIGAALCSVFLAIAAGLITSRRTRMELEHDYFAQGASALCATGWILMIVAVSRMSIEAALIPQFSYIALIVSGFLGTSLVFVSTIQYNQWFSSTGIAASTLSIAFCGGVLSHSGVKMQICANSKVGCAYFWSVAFSGAFLYLVGASVCLVTRFIHSNTEEETETQAIAQLQIKDYRETLEQPSETAEGILEILRPDDEDDNFYQWLSLSQLWLPWKLCALMCFMSWTVYLGGLGSTSDSDLFSEVTTASTIFAIFAPFGLVGLVYSLIRNSRPLMATAVCVSSISMLSAGRMISVVWLNPYSSWAASLSGLSIFILFFSACISLIFFRMKLLISREEKQSQFSSRISFIVYSSLFVGIVGMIICATGVGVLYGSTDLVPFRVQPFVGIAGTVLGFLSVTMNAIAFQLLFREGMDVTGASSTDWVWPPVLMITLNLSIYLVTLLSYLPIGSMLFISAGHISNCVAGISSCTSGTMPPILVFIGVLIYIMGSLCFLTFVTLNSKAMKLDGDLFLLTPQKRELEPLTKILGDIDLYTMVLASPILQQRLKICIGLYIISFFAFIVPYGSFAVFVKLTNNVGIAIPFAVLSVATPILLSAWILVGNVVLQYASLMTILVCTCFAGYLLCWGIFFGLAYPASIAASALLYVIVTSVVLMGCLSWYSFRDTNMYFSARSKYLLGIAQAGWVLFIAGFVLQHLAVTKVIGYAEEVSGWLFVVSGFCFTGLHLLQDYEVQFIRLISYCSLGWSISFGGSVFLLALAALNSTALMTYTILKIVGSAIYVAFMIAFIIHKNIFSFIELTEQEDGQLTWKSKLSPREKELHWIHQPQFRNCLMMYFIWILLTTAGIFVLILSFVILGDVGNSLLAHSFFVAICVSLVSHVVYIYLRWEAFGWFYVLATCVASCLCGPTVSYAINVPSTSTPFAVIIGCVLAILGNTAVFALLICDMKTCDARWFMICIKTVIGLSAVGILLNIVGLAINTSIILIPAILSVSFPGICAVLYIIFIYIWRPEAPKVKSLAELFGYTIVKKKDLEDALTSNEDLNSAEKLENEEKKKKNPVFKVLIKKPKPKPIVQRKTINDWLRLLFGSQQTALSLVVFSLFVNGMTAQFMGARLQKDGSDGGNLQTYLLFLGSMLTLAALVVYIIVLAITCLIDETNVIENARPVVKEPQDMPAHRVIDDIQDVDVAELHAASIDLPKESQLPQEADLPVSSFPNEMQEVSQRTRLAEVVIEKPTSRPQAARLEHVDEYDNAGSSDDEYIPKPVPTQSNSKDPFSENYRPALQPISQPSKSPETPVEVINEGSGSKWIKKPTAQTPEPLSLEDLVEEF